MNHLMDAINKGEVVVFAGAGISKDAPANIPDWNKYNNLLINEIGNIGSQFLEEPNNLLGDEDYSKILSLTSLSDFIFNYIAGEYYFPLLRVLDGAQPNSHHLLLASLAKAKKIRAVVTTNFDTLIEQAFTIKEIPFQTYDSSCNFRLEHNLNVFPIYKIHGSVTNAKEAIDTVSQKLPGLSTEKREVLKHLLETNHFIFMGFSGADFDFKEDYIPITYAEKGITWVTWNISERLLALKESVSGFEIKLMDSRGLDSFYEEIGWKDYWEGNRDGQNKPICYDAISREIRNTLINSPVPLCAFAGMCIKILEAMAKYEEADKYVEIFDKKLMEIFSGEDSTFDHIIIPDVIKSSIQPSHRLSLGKVTHTEAYSYIALLDTIGDIFLRQKTIEVALEYYDFSLRIQKVREFMYLQGDLPCNPSKLYNNLSTTLGRFVRVYMMAEDYDAAHTFSVTAELNALSANRLYDFSIMHYYNVVSTYKGGDRGKYVRELCVCVRLAQMSGAVDVLFDVYVAIANYYFNQNEIAIGNCALQEAYKYSKISFANYQHKEKLDCCEHNATMSKEFRNSVISYGIYTEDDPKNQWEGVVERNILEYEEGRLAKKKYEEGKYEESIAILKDASIKYAKVGSKSKLAEELFSFTIVRVILLSGFPVDNNRLLAQLEKCIHLQIENLQTDYLVLTMHYYSQLLMQNNQFSEALFYTEIILCICVSPEEHSVILGVCLTAVECCLRTNSNADARDFLIRYLNYCKEYPEYVDHSMDDYVRNAQEILQVQNSHELYNDTDME